MNAVEFLTSHRVVANRHARGAPVPHLTDKAVKTALSDLNKGVAYNAVQWRGRGGGLPTPSAVEFDRQLDKISIWLETWTHAQRCAFLQDLLRRSSYTQIQFLHTVLQPSLHRDFMYTVRSRFPDLEFTPVSTHVTRELKDKLSRLRLDNFHRVGSAYIQQDKDIENVKLPLLPQETSRSTNSLQNAIGSWTSQDRLNHRKEVQGHKDAYTKDKDRWISNGKEEGEKSVIQDAVSRFVEMPVRRHVQDEQSKQDAMTAARKPETRGYKSLHSSRSSFECRGSKRKSKSDQSSIGPHSMEAEGTAQILTWFTDEWNDTKKNEFLHKLVLKLDPRQHYFISSFLSLKQHKDIVGLLPDKLALKVLGHLTARELLVAARVSKRWAQLANDNRLWKAKCSEHRLEVPVPAGANWKNVYRDNLYLRTNWNRGLCRTMDFRGHTHSVLCVTCDQDRLASGSQDRTIRVFDLLTGQLLHLLRGHTKGVWCLQFFTRHLLVSGSYDNTIRVWNLRTGVCTRTLLGHSAQVWCLRRHGNMLVSGSQDRTAKLWDIGRCLLLRTLMGHNAAVFSTDVSEDGATVVTGSADRSVRLWSRDTGLLQKVIWVSPTTSIMSVSYSHGYIACCYDGTVCLYRGGKLVQTFKEHRKRVETVSLKITDANKCEGSIISAGKDGLIKYWDTNKEASVQTFQGHHNAVNCVYVDELRIASASYDNKIRVWDFNMGMPPPVSEDVEEEEERGSPKEEE
ncbi:F-box protein MET30 [Aplysia californica]|uniref:F-box protein MET30 n=1 Tax=Aplysia californica TaxID=6500 RepID=A0ABM1A5Z4_APLCA|nr:F-box protein MET30 [Aplysia californica]